MSSSRNRVRAVGLGVAVLCAGVFPEVAASASTRTPRVVDETSIERAKTGISLFVIDNALTAETGIAAPCPMMTIDEFGWFMGQQGLSPNLAGWAVDLSFYDDVGDGAPAISCGVDVEAHLDQFGSGPPHGASLEAMLLPENATFNDVLGLVERAVPIGPGSPDIGGEIGGACYTGELAACIMMWHRSGLVFTTILAGPAADVTQERTIALLTSMVPTMVQGLAAYADATVPGTPTTAAATAPTVPAPTVPAPTVPAPTVPAPTVPAPTVPVPTVPVPTVPVPTSAPAPGALDLAAARATLASFLAANPVGTDVVTAPGATVVCPGSGPEQIGQAMTSLGLVPNLTGFRVKVEQSGIAPTLRTVSCGGDVIAALVDSMTATTTSHTPLLTMYDIAGIATLDQVLAERPGLTLLQSNVPTIGGDIYGATCDAASGTGTFCVRVWHREGFVVMVEIAGTAQPGFDQVATQLITTLVPGAVNDLATHATWPPAAGIG